MIKGVGILEPVPRLYRAIDTRGINGRQVAVDSWLEALLRYGTSDTYHFFVDDDDFDIAERSRREWIITEPSFKRAKIHRKRNLLNALSQSPRLHLHNPNSMADTLRLLGVRVASGSDQWTVSTVHHALSYGHQPTVLSDLLINGLGPNDIIVATSAYAETALRSMLELAGERLGVPTDGMPELIRIPLAVEANRYFRPRDRKDARKQMNLPSEGLILLWVGRLSFKDKLDVSVLLRSFSQLNPTSRNYFLVLAGDDSDNTSSTIDALASAYGIANRTIVITNPSHVALRILYSAVDIFIAPVDNLQESFGIAVIEAMASGLPVVASDWSGYRDTVVHGTTGFLISTIGTGWSREIELLSGFCDWREMQLILAQSIALDEDCLVRCTQTLLENESLRLKMGRNGRQRALQLFDWKGVISQYEAAWELLDERTNQSNLTLSVGLGSNYNKHFAHSLSRRLTKNSYISAVENSVDIATFLYLNPYCVPQVPVGLLVSIQRAASERTQVSELPDRLAKSNNDLSTIFSGVMWLIKYGYLGLVE